MIRGAGGSTGKMAGGEQHTPVEAPDTLHSVAFARIIDLISEGECVGFENGLQDVFFDETPVQNPDGSFNFKNVTFDFRPGTQDQTPLPNFPEVENETGVGVPLEDDTPWTHDFTNLALTGIRIRLSVAALSQIDEETGDTNGYVVEYAIDMAVDGGAYETILESAFSGKASSPFERSHAIDLPPATANWLIRVRRITANSASAYIQDDTSVVSYTELVRANLRMPNSAVAGMIVDASQFRSIPTRAYRFTGRIIRVPSNYDPATRVYTGVWDGTFQVAWSNNPAWIYYDMATSYRYGLGRFISDAQIDKWSLYAIGQYCDELVDDGLGGSEPRFTCDIYLQKAADAYKVMQDLASVFRGMSYWAGGQIVAVCDWPQDPIYSYSNANVIEGRFEYQSSSRQARHNVALVGWSDPLDFGRGKIQYVPYEAGIARYGIQRTELTAIGATSQGQAERCGNWVLLSENYETNTVTFRVGLDGAIPQPGKVIRVADTLRSGARIGGRIRAATTTVITPDAMPTVAIGNTLTAILSDGIAYTRPVSAVGADTITVSPAFPSAPVVEGVWVVESVEAVAQLFRVIGVKEDANSIYTIMALQHNPAKFTESDFGILVQSPTPLPNTAPNTAIAPPTTVTVTSAIVADGPVPRTAVTATWPAVAGATSYEVSYKRNLGQWSDPVRVKSAHFDVPNSVAGDYRVRVKSISATGLGSLERLSNTTPVIAPIASTFVLDDGSGGTKTISATPDGLVYSDTEGDHAIAKTTDFGGFAIAGGTANALTAAIAPAPTIVDGTEFRIRAAYQNTAAATFSVNGGSALALTNLGGRALSPGDIRAAGHELTIRYVAAIPRFELVNPHKKTIVGAHWGVPAGALVPLTSAKVDVRVPNNRTIIGWQIVTQGGPGGCTIGIAKGTVGGWPPSSSIVALAPPTIAAGHVGSDTVLSGWTTAINAGDFLRFELLTSSVFSSVDILLELL